MAAADVLAKTSRKKAADAAIIAWAGGLDDGWFAADLSWYSGALKRDMAMPRAPLVVHFFNHQTRLGSDVRA